MKRLLLAIIIAVFFLGRAYAGADDILAKVGDRSITKADFDVLVKYYSDEKGRDLSGDEKFKTDLLDILIKRTALADMARKKGIDKRKDVVLLSELNVNGVLMSALLKQEVNDKVEVTEQDMKLYYTINGQEFKRPEMTKVRHILISTIGMTSEDEKTKAKEKIEGILKRILAGEDFAKLALEFSDDAASKNKGGELGFIKQSMTVKPFEDAAFSLKPGEVSGIVETRLGYHIIKCEEKSTAGTEPFDKVKDTIKEKVLQQVRQGKTKDLTDKALTEAKVEKHPELLTGEKK